MPNIHDITISDLKIPAIDEWIMKPPNSVPIAPPITSQIGIPVIDLPGCVEAHIEAKRSTALTIDDKDGVYTYCDAGLPSFRPIDYSRENLKFTAPAAVPPYKKKEDKEDSSIEAPKIPINTATVNCPENTKFNITLQKCVKVEVIEEKAIPWTEEYLPPLGTVTTTATIATVATVSALLAKPIADLVLKTVKPITKKVVKKVATLRGKKPKAEATSERRLAQRDRNRALLALRRALKK